MRRGAAAAVLAFTFATSRLAPLDAGPPPSPPVAEARRLSATVHAMWGREEYVQARPLAERALALRIADLGPEDPEVAVSSYQLAEICRATGDYATALRLHRRAIAIWDKALGPENSESASSLHYLGVLELLTGDRAGAQLLLERALAIRERTLGPAHEQVATTLNALAGVMAQRDDRVAAARLLERAQRIWEQKLGAGHPFVARSLTGRAGLLAGGGDLAGARELLERALEIRIKAFGPEHYLVARNLADIAGLLSKEGDRAGAEARYLRALDLQKRALGPGHPEVASTLAALARLHWSGGRREPALTEALQAEELARSYFRRSVKGLSDSEALQYEGIRTSGLNVALSILASGSPAAADPPPEGALSGRALRRIADEVIRSRAMVLDEMVRRTRAATSGENPATGPAPRVVERGLSDMLAALPERTALVSFVRYNRLERPRFGSTPEYLALIMKSGVAVPVPIRLGPAERVEASVAAWQGEVASDPRLRRGDDGERSYREAGAALRRAIWDPLASALAGARQVFVVPDGAIGQVALAALPAAGERYLVETGPPIHYLSAERDLVVDRRPGARGRGLLVIGGPDFDAFPDAVVAAPPPLAGTPGHGAQPLCSEFAALRFEALPGSLAETEEVTSLFAGRAPIRRLIGYQASEAAFRKYAVGSRVLHLATHAYLLPDRCGSSPGLSDLLQDSFVAGDRPLLRAGLALRGANRRGDPGAAGDLDDGILTAEEIASLDLKGVEWAVLSACQTGAGKVVAGEGVIGLKRAFMMAGARTLIVSLWAVDDGAARVFMRGLYGKRLSRLSTIESIRQASLQVLETQRREGRTTHPYFWGSFVAIGDWR